MSAAAARSVQEKIVFLLFALWNVLCVPGACLELQKWARLLLGCCRRGPRAGGCVHLHGEGEEEKAWLSPGSCQYHSCHCPPAPGSGSDGEGLWWQWVLGGAGSHALGAGWAKAYGCFSAALPRAGAGWGLGGPSLGQGCDDDVAVALHSRQLVALKVHHQLVQPCLARHELHPELGLCLRLHRILTGGGRRGQVWGP